MSARLGPDESGRANGADSGADSLAGLSDGAGMADESETYNLRLYVAGQTPRSAAALANLTTVCERHLAGRYRIEVIDLLEQPQLAAGDQILAIPTLVRRLPPPLKRLIGNLANTERILVGLDLRPGEK